MKSQPHILSLLIACALFFACEEKSKFSLKTTATDLIVVEGVITNENTSHRISFSHTFTSQNEMPPPLTPDTVLITDGENIYSLTESPKGSGKFFTPPFRAVFGRVYFLVFFYQGIQYTAVDSPPPGQPFTNDSVAIKEGTNYKLRLKDSGTSSNFIEYDVNWENTTSCDASADCTGRLVYYDLKTIDVHEIYKPDKEVFFFSEGSQIIRKKYSVSEPYEVYLRSLLSETEWRGGIFDIQRANVTTNLSEGAIGFFAASTVVRDTTIVK